MGSGDSRTRIFKCGGLVLAVVLVVSLIVVPMAHFFDSSGGVLAAASAAAICLFTGWASVAVVSIFQTRSNVMLGAGLAMAIRMVPPLVVCLLLAVRREGQEHLIFVYSLLVYYMATLAADVWITVRVLQSPALPSEIV